jgi:hypothetical protein
VGPTGSVGAGMETLNPTWIRYTDRPGSGELLYRLSYPGPYITLTKVLFVTIRDFNTAKCQICSRNTDWRKSRVAVTVGIEKHGNGWLQMVLESS